MKLMLLFFLSFTCLANDYATNKRLALKALRKSNLATDQLRKKVEYLSQDESFIQIEEKISTYLKEGAPYIAGSLLGTFVLAMVYLKTMPRHNLIRLIMHMEQTSQRPFLGPKVVGFTHLGTMAGLFTHLVLSSFVMDHKVASRASGLLGLTALYMGLSNGSFASGLRSKIMDPWEIKFPLSRRDQIIMKSSFVSVGGIALAVSAEGFLQDLQAPLEASITQDIYQQALQNPMFKEVVKLLGDETNAKAYVRHLFVDNWKLSAILEHDLGLDAKDAREVEEKLNSEHPEIIFERIQEWIVGQKLEEEQS